MLLNSVELNIQMHNYFWSKINRQADQNINWQIDFEFIKVMIISEVYMKLNLYRQLM